MQPGQRLGTGNSLFALHDLVSTRRKPSCWGKRKQLAPLSSPSSGPPSALLPCAEAKYLLMRMSLSPGFV